MWWKCHPRWSTVERSDHVSKFWSTRRQSQPQSFSGIATDDLAGRMVVTILWNRFEQNTWKYGTDNYSSQCSVWSPWTVYHYMEFNKPYTYWYTLVFWDPCFWEELYPSSTKSCGWTSLHMANSGCNSNTSLKFQQYCIGFVELCDVVIYSLLRLDRSVRTYNCSVFSKCSFP